jgi:hypothetical protein
MTGKIYLTVGLCLLAALSFSQKVHVSAYILDKPQLPGSDTIYYSLDRPLTWTDFQGVPERNNDAGAVTSSGFGYGAGITQRGEDTYINLGVYTYFSRSRSWKKPIIHTNYHLEHEQHHFDITMLGAERFCDAIKKAHFTNDNYKELISQIFDRIFNENTELQERYDNETEHSINEERQFAWNKQINEAMGREYLIESSK